MSKYVLSKIVDQLYLGGEHALKLDWLAQLNRTGIKVVFTPNPEQVVLAHEDAYFLRTLLAADWLLPDGVGLLLVARGLFPQETKQLGRVTGTDMLQWWLGQASERGEKTFLLGGFPGVAERLAKRVDPTSQWCLGLAGYANIHSPQPEEEKVVLQEIRRWAPKVLWVAFGAPYQELWVAQHKEFLQKAGVKVVAVCGGAFDFLTGDVQRAPQWVRSLGLEWFYRLWAQPWRWKRQLKLVKFVFLVAQQWYEKVKR